MLVRQLLDGTLLWPRLCPACAHMRRAKALHDQAKAHEEKAQAWLRKHGGVQ